MSAISLAVGADRISRVVGYIIQKGAFQLTTPNLPQRIAIFGEANDDKQSGLSEDPREVTNAQEVGDIYGYGSPLHQIMRILRPIGSDGVGGIPTLIYPQPSDGGATATVTTISLTVATNPSSNTTHYVRINGRLGVDGESYGYSVTTDDTESTLLAKIADAVNNVLSAPCSAAVTGTPPDEVVEFTTKWKGATAAELDISFETGDNDAGITYSIDSKVDGTGAISIATALSNFGNDWNTIVVNPYGSTVFGDLEAFNGIPDPDNPTGRYQGTIMKPFVAIWGSTESNKTTLGAITDARKAQVTNALAPAPNSKGFTWEAAANLTYQFALIAQNKPHLDVNGKAYPDMPIPIDDDIGDMANYNDRDYLVKKGASTIDLVASQYVIQDFVTTYHPDGEIPPQFRYPRNLMLDFNIRYGYYLLEQINVVDNAIAPSEQVVTVDATIKPAQWKQILNSYADDLSERALIAEPEFMKENILVQVSDTNPDRLETQFKYKRTGIARISSTTAIAGFAFGVI